MHVRQLRLCSTVTRTGLDNTVISRANFEGDGTTFSIISFHNLDNLEIQDLEKQPSKLLETVQFSFILID